MTLVQTPAVASQEKLTFWKTEHFRVALLLIGILLFVYRDVVFGGRTFLVGPDFPGVTSYGPYGDPAAYVKNQFFSLDAGAIAWQMEPWEKMINQMYASGEMPLWNPHSGLGYPFYANPHSAPFDPLMMLIYLAPEALWTVMVDFHLLLLYFLGAFFLYLFMRQLGVSVGPAVFSGVGFVLSTYFWTFTTISFARADLLLPMLIYSYHCLAVSPTRKNAAFAILALWLIIVTGFPETLPLHIGMAGLWFVLQIVLKSRAEPGLSHKQFGLRLGLLAAVIATSILLAAFILVPFIEFLQLADHIHAPATRINFSDLWTLFQSLTNLILPLPNKLMVSTNVNILVWLLAIYGALKSSQPSSRKTFYARFFILLALLIALVTFRAPILGLIISMPIINMISLPRFAPMLITFCAACAAGIGLAKWMSQKRFKIDKSLLLLSLILIMPLLVGFVMPSLNSQFRADYKQDFLLVILVLLIFHTIVIFNISSTISNRAATALIVALLVLSPQSWSQFSQRPERYDPFVVPPFIHFLQSQPDQDFRVLGLDFILYPNTAGVFGIDDVRYLDAMIPKSFVRYAKELIFKPIEVARFSGRENIIQFDRGLNLLNVKYVIAGTKNNSFENHLAQSQLTEGQFEEVYTDDLVRIYRNAAAFPHAFVVHQFELVKNTEEAISRLKDPSFDPSQSVLIEGNIRETLSPPNGTTSSKAVVTNRTTNSMRIDVTTEKAGILVVSEQSFPGWEAFVDGQPTEILTANATMRAVYLEAGTHTVEFRFNPLSLRLGVAISGATLFILAVFYLFYFIRQRKI
jgi:hypothetical protein